MYREIKYAKILNYVLNQNVTRQNEKDSQHFRLLTPWGSDCITILEFFITR